MQEAVKTQSANEILEYKWALANVFQRLLITEKKWNWGRLIGLLINNWSYSTVQTELNNRQSIIKAAHPPHKGKADDEMEHSQKTSSSSSFMIEDILNLPSRQQAVREEQLRFLASEFIKRPTPIKLDAFPRFPAELLFLREGKKAKKVEKKSSDKKFPQKKDHKNHNSYLQTLAMLS